MPDLPQLDAMDPFTRLDRVGDVIGEAEAKGVVDPLPRREGDVKEAPVTFARVATIRERLYLLGYIDTPSGRLLDAHIRRAIRQFQTEAGLQSVDGWIGNETWESLQQLVSFEVPFDSVRWLRPGAERALFRAARLRLHALGFLEDRTVGLRNRAFGLALFRFQQAAVRLGFPRDRLTVRQTAYEVLFDQDALVSRLAGTDLERTDGTQEERDTLVRLAVGVARVELWLLGYATRPGSPELYRGPVGLDALGGDLADALAEFWTDTGGDRAAPSRARRIDRSFFQELARLARERPGEGPEDVDDLLGVLEASEPGIRDRIWSEIRSLGSRIWDGVKRAWGWLKSALSRGLGIVAEGLRRAGAWIRNAARVLYGYALRTFEAVKLAYAAVRQGLSLLGSPMLPGTRAEVLAIRHDRDLDLRCFVNAGAARSEVRSVIASVRGNAVRFRVGARIVGIFTDYLTGSVKRFAGGWFGLIFSLVKLVGVLRELGEVVDEAAYLLATA